MESKFGKLIEISSHGILCNSPDKTGLILGKSLITGTITIFFYPDHEFKWFVIYLDKVSLIVFSGELSDVLAEGGFRNPELALTNEIKNHLEQAVIYIEDYSTKGLTAVKPIV